MELPRLARAPLRTAALALLLAIAVGAPAAGARPSAGTPSHPALDLDPLTPPPGDRLDATEVRRIAAAAPVIAAELRRHPGLRAFAYALGAQGWQVSWFEPGRTGRELALAEVSDRTGRVTEAWTGFQVAWSMARGYPGAFGRHLTDWFVWAALCVLFAVGFVPRRAREVGLLQLDGLVLLAFSVSLAFFDHGRIGISVPLAYPPLLYLLARMLCLAAGRGRPRRRPRLLVPSRWMLVGLLFLVGFRVALNVSDANVIDVGYAGVVGADRIVHSRPLYGGWPPPIRAGDTYGPVNYLAYVPFRAALGFGGTWDELPAAHGAAIAFDLLTLVGLFLLGRRIRGPDTGIRLAYLWAAFPFTAFALESNSDDALVALAVVVALLVIRSPGRRGVAAALAGLTKFAPLALAPLLWRGPDERVRLRPLTAFAAAFALAAAIAMLPVLLTSELTTFWRHTIAYQAGRGSPFSVWGLWGGLGTEQRAVQGAAIALALAGFWVPRRRTVGRVAAMGAATLIAVQLGLTHWFYLYIPWFFPLVLVALEDGTSSDPEAGRAPPGASQAALSPGPGRPAAAPIRSTPPAAAPQRSG